MKSLFLLIPLLLLGLAGDGKKDGRRGNARYQEGAYEAAADAYYAGLAAYKEGQVDATYYGLQNNLGAALHKQGEFKMAGPAFLKALETAPTKADYARSAYNAGNNAFRAEEAEAALAYYRKALLAEPANTDAKFNYEFVKRRLQQQQQQQQQQGQGENQEQQDDQDQDQNQQSENQQNQDQQQNQERESRQNQNDEQQEQPSQEQQQPSPEESEQLSRQQAERILQALENEEEQLLREVRKLQGRPRRVEKDW